MEFGLCIFTVIYHPVVSRFIVNLPADNSRIIAIMYCQAGNDIFYIMTVAIATPGSVLTSSVLNGHSIIPLNQYVGIFFRQPDGRRGGRCTHDYFQTILLRQRDCTIQPFKMIFSLFRFHHSPGELCKMGELDAHFRHFLQITLPLGGIPLLGIIVRAQSKQLFRRKRLIDRRLGKG